MTGIGFTDIEDHIERFLNEVSRSVTDDNASGSAPEDLNHFDTLRITTFSAYLMSCS